MTTPFKCAIWAAVSTIAQTGPDKFSLSDQEKTARDLIARREWQETSGPYIVDGVSRTRFVNLRDAEEAMPALRQMLDDAQAGKFQLLILYDFNRFRDLLHPVAKVLAHYGVQLYSIIQPVEPVPPMGYGPHANGTSDIVQTMSRLVSGAQIQDLRDKYKSKMPRRITDRGLPIRIPYGYRKPDGQQSNRSAVPVKDPVESGWVLVMKDMLLTGKTLREICEYLESEHVRPPRGVRWWPQTVRDLLVNPFFTGLVEFGKSRVKTDPRANTSYRNRKIPADQVVKGQGKHAPLWSMDTHRAILAEIDGRAIKYTNRRANQLSGLLRCAECDATLWLYYSGARERDDGDRRVWRCSVAKAEHGSWPYADVLEWVTAELVRRLADERVTVPAQATPTPARDELAELKAQRTRVEQAYEKGGYSLETFLSKVDALDSRIATLADTETAVERAADVRERWAEMAGSMRAMLGELPEWVREEEPLTVNRALRVLIDHITIKGDAKVAITFRA